MRITAAVPRNAELDALHNKGAKTNLLTTSVKADLDELNALESVGGGQKGEGGEPKEAGAEGGGVGGVKEEKKDDDPYAGLDPIARAEVRHPHSGQLKASLSTHPHNDSHSTRPKRRPKRRRRKRGRRRPLPMQLRRRPPRQLSRVLQLLRR